MIEIASDLHNMYIVNTSKGELVREISAFLCNLTHAVTKGVGLDGYHKVYISARALKHSYDKRPAFEYDTIISNLHKIMKYPDKIYRNKQGKRGEYCFVKAISTGEKYLCIVEKGKQCLEIVTCYRVPKEKYLNSFSLVWSWRDDNFPHRDIFDYGENQSTNAPQ